ncbi:peptide chain release factor N(5)-glutamine methyltransferase [Aquibacillus salsiterrae]|uniref:Release factor glutamine methyltransferase n=1 Tax=Aquibacillus salsiterrae TaxID=2950439 RepID=A0A9X3WBR0_9BACI|nr:peptide chain release factor N(5)-glutamine methyltransferase [Aquibacillus salsiterrae]MDC3416750.1 peptide chain release factor N(5)-glutamine methyltransferase [Aquibacillus salsiterrae]
MDTMKIHEALRWASLFLQKHNREERVGEILLLHHLGMSKVEFLSSLREQVPQVKLKAFCADVRRHAETGVPVQHLTGVESFYGRTFHVNGDVLIPRPETEELIVGVLEYVEKIDWHGQKTHQLVDVGTGSGIIAITLKLERQASLDVSACDISDDALAVATANALALGAQVDFLQGNFLKPLLDKGKKVDIIASNPPYIPYAEKATLSDTVKNYDPALALYAEDDGLAAYKKIIAQAVDVLRVPGLIAFEIGHEQGNAVREIILQSFPHSNVEVRKDINGKDRMVFAVIDSRK